MPTFTKAQMIEMAAILARRACEARPLCDYRDAITARASEIATDYPLLTERQRSIVAREMYSIASTYLRPAVAPDFTAEQLQRAATYVRDSHEGGTLSPEIVATFASLIRFAAMNALPTNKAYIEILSTLNTIGE